MEVPKERNCLLLKNMIVFEDVISESLREIAKKAEITLFTFEQVVMRGKQSCNEGTASFDSPTSDTIYFISYTSGTTGDPKGVKVSHKATLCTAASIDYMLGKDMESLTSKDMYLSYLPAAHVFE